MRSSNGLRFAISVVLAGALVTAVLAYWARPTAKISKDLQSILASHAACDTFDEGRLELRLVDADTLPFSMPVRDVAVGIEDDLWVVSADSKLWHRRDGIWRAVETPEIAPRLIAVLGASVYLVTDTQLWAIADDSKPPSLARTTKATITEVVAATDATGLWAIESTDSVNHRLNFLSLSNGGDRGVDRDRAAVLSPLAAGFVAATLIEAPFTTTFYDTAFSVHGVVRPDRLPDSAARSADHVYKTTAFESLGCGTFLQVIADLRSDERLLVLFGLRGGVLRQLRVATITQPISFFAADKGNKRLWGMRHLANKKREVLTYSW